MIRRRPVARRKDLASGPGKLCAALGIDRSLDGADMTDLRSDLFIARNPDVSAFIAATGPLLQTTRIGLSKAADWPLRFLLLGSEHVSKRPRA